MSSRIFTVSAICLGLTAACSKSGGTDDSGASCEAVGEKFVKISRAAVNKLEGEERKHAEAMLSLLPKIKKDLVAECKKHEWSEAARKCMVAAKDENEAQACRAHIDGNTARGGSAKTASDEAGEEKPDRAGEEKPDRAGEEKPDRAGEEKPDEAPASDTETKTE